MLEFLILLAFILISLGLARYFVRHDRGEREPVGALWLALAFGLGGGIIAAIIEGLVLSVKNLQPGAPLHLLFPSSIAVGIIEEFCKFVPFSLFVFRKRYFNEHTDGIIYFAIVGLGFGLPENILYTLQFGAGVGVGRIILTPIFHAAITGMVGYFLAKGKLASNTRNKAWVALVFAMLLHGFYDFGLISGIGVFALLSIIITLGLSIGLFLLYNRATELDRAVGLSVVGQNNFCRNCGFPNPKHYLYCTRCGKHA